MADGKLRARPDGGQHLRRKVLLSIHVPARRRPLNFRSGAHVQLAEAASGMRLAMPDLRDPLPGGRYQAQRRDRHERMLLLPRLPSHLLRRPDLPAHDRPPQTPHRTATSDRQHCRPFDWYPTSEAEALNVWEPRGEEATRSG